jgi:hypothetical protein
MTMHHLLRILTCTSSHVADPAATDAQFEQESEAAPEEFAAVEGQEEPVPEEATDPSASSFPNQGKPRCILLLS